MEGINTYRISVEDKKNLVDLMEKLKKNKLVVKGTSLGSIARSLMLTWMEINMKRLEKFEGGEIKI